MANERPNESSLVPFREPRQQSLSQTPAKDLLFLVVGKSDLPVADMKARFVGLITQKPEAMRLAIATAYYHPEVINQLETKPTPTLENIRENYRRVIELFPDETMSEVAAKTPLASQRLNEEKETLSLAGETGIKDAEIALMLMSEYGDTSKLTIEDYSRVVAFHELYGNMIRHLRQANGKALSSFSEIERFFQVGQNLLTARRLYEYEVETVDDDYSQKAPSRSADYQGRIAQLTLMSVISGNLRAIDPKSPEIDHIKKSFVHLLDETQSRHPERVPEIIKMFGGTQDVGKMSAWVQTVGEPGLSTENGAEWVSFTHSGND